VSLPQDEVEELGDRPRDGRGDEHEQAYDRNHARGKLELLRSSEYCARYDFPKDEDECNGQQDGAKRGNCLVRVLGC